MERERRDTGTEMREERAGRRNRIKWRKKRERVMKGGSKDGGEEERWEEWEGEAGLSGGYVEGGDSSSS